MDNDIKNIYWKKLFLLDKLLNKILLKSREKIKNIFFNEINYNDEISLLDIGTTANRYFFLDFHTKIPFIHFLLKKIHRKILSLLGYNFFSNEKNLNLLSKKNMINLCQMLKIKHYKIISYKLIFFTSNLLLIIQK
jgi:hypothetical protein